MLKLMFVRLYLIWYQIYQFFSCPDQFFYYRSFTLSLMLYSINDTHIATAPAKVKLKLPLLNTDCSLHAYFTIIKLLIIFSPLHFFSCVTNRLCWHEEEVGYLSAMLYSGQHYLVGRCFLIVLWLCIMKILEYLIWHNLQVGLVIY